MLRSKTAVDVRHIGLECVCNVLLSGECQYIAVMCHYTASVTRVLWSYACDVSTDTVGEFSVQQYIK